jgi:ribosomal protein L10
LSQQVQVHKREPSAEKIAIVDRIAKLAKAYPVLCVTKLSKVRSAQLMAVRKVLRGNAEIVVVKNKLAILGLKRAGLKNADIQAIPSPREEQGQPRREGGGHRSL